MKFFIGIGFLCIALGVWWQLNPESSLERGFSRTSNVLKNVTNKVSITGQNFIRTIQNRVNGIEDSRLRVAKYYENKGLIELALHKYKQLADGTADKNIRDRANFHIARIQLAISYHKEGTGRLYSLLSQTNDSILRSEVYCELGIFDFESKEFEKALKNFELALHENSNHHKARVYLARTWATLGNKEQAREVYKYYLTYHSALDGEKEKNQELLSRIFKSDFIVKEPTFAKDSKTTEESKSLLLNNDAVYFQKGLEAFQTANYSLAISIFSNIVKQTLDPEKKELSKYYLAESFYQKEDYEQAMHCYDEIIKTLPVLKDEESFLKKGQILFRKNDYENAMTNFWTYQKEFPNGKYTKIVNDWLSEIKFLLKDRTAVITENSTKKTENSTKKTEREISVKKPFLKINKTFTEKPVSTSSQKVILKNSPSWEDVSSNLFEEPQNNDEDYKYSFPINREQSYLDDDTELSP